MSDSTAMPSSQWSDECHEPAEAPTCRCYTIRNVALTGWHEKMAGRWHYRDLAADADWFHGWISFDALCWDDDAGMLYCGLNSLDGDLLYRFDPSDGSFTGLNTQRWADAFDSKIHRTLLQNSHDGCLYFGTSLLHDADQQREAPGGKLVKYDPKRDEYAVMDIPEPHLYLQSIAADWERGILYAFTYPAEFVVRFDLATGKSRRLAYVGNATMFAQPHNAVVDDQGCLWGTYAETRAWDETPSAHPVRLFRYEPDEDVFTWFDHGLSRRDETENLLTVPPPRFEVPKKMVETRHKDDYGFCDGMAYPGGRYIYAGTVAGVLCRIDTTDGSVQRLAHVAHAGRLPAIHIRDGILYAAGGVKEQTQAIRWDMDSTTVEDLPDLIDPSSGERPARIHEITVDDQGTVYLAENDNHHRSSWLWTIQA